MAHKTSNKMFCFAMLIFQKTDFPMSSSQVSVIAECGRITERELQNSVVGIHALSWVTQLNFFQGQ